MDGEQFCEVIRRVKATGGIEVFLILAVAALRFAVVARCIGADELVSDTQLGGGGLKQCGKIPFAVGEAIGKFKAVIRLDTFHADSSTGVPLEQLFLYICGGTGGLLWVSGQEAEAGKLVNSSDWYRRSAGSAIQRLGTTFTST